MLVILSSFLVFIFAKSVNVFILLFSLIKDIKIILMNGDLVGHLDDCPIIPYVGDSILSIFLVYGYFENHPSKG